MQIEVLTGPVAPWARQKPKAAREMATLERIAVFLPSRASASPESPPAPPAPAAFAAAEGVAGVGGALLLLMTPVGLSVVEVL